MKKIYFYLIAGAVLCFSCRDAEIAPISDSSGKPEKVEILAVDTVPGGVAINYKIPPINDIIEIKAVYTLSNGKIRESSSSFYTSYITIDGYNDTGEHEALIYTINRAREMSDAVPVKFRPGESNLSKAAKSMQVIEDFGGVNFSWRNPDKAMLTFEFYTENERGEMVTMNILSSKTDSTDLSFRGYDTIPRKFAVNIRDNFGNASGIIYPEGEYITPLYEILLDKTIQKIPHLTNDTDWQQWGSVDRNFIDDDKTTFVHTLANTVPGATITIDLGRKAKLSRFLIFQRTDENHAWNSGNPRVFEVYTTDDTGDAPNGDWSEWTLRRVCTVVRPSSVGGTAEDDRIALENGHEFSLPLDTPPVKYIRLKIITSWVYNYSHPTELTMYGFYVE
ncbi:MAG: DUF4959 domain-containing protein [Tannerella sp.]|jgi:hypothetical protein|nr:DUF4959 domain-containing protein [Tannerella sp.]